MYVLHNVSHIIRVMWWLLHCNSYHCSLLSEERGVKPPTLFTYCIAGKFKFYRLVSIAVELKLADIKW